MENREKTAHNRKGKNKKHSLGGQQQKIRLGMRNEKKNYNCIIFGQKQSLLGSSSQRTLNAKSMFLRFLVSSQQGNDFTRSRDKNAFLWTVCADERDSYLHNTLSQLCRLCKIDESSKLTLIESVNMGICNDINQNYLCKFCLHTNIKFVIARTFYS